MQFEWDERKRRENIARRGVDFLRAAMVFADPDRLEASDDRADYGEARLMALGAVDDEIYVVVYTMRGEVHRIITAWKVGADGKNRYRTLLAGRDPRGQ